MKRGVSRKAVRNVILKGERIEEYPGDWPLPSALLFGWTDARPIHVVAAFDNVAQIIYIITVYEPSLEYFASDFRTRKKK